MQPIHEKVRQAIRTVAKENGYVIIFDSREAINNNRFLTYKNEADDITLLLKIKLE